MRRSATLLILAVVLGIMGTLHGGLGRQALADTPSPFVSPSAGPSPSPSPQPKCSRLTVHAPNSVADLTVTTENPCGTFLESKSDRALDSIALLALRRGDQQLMATLEVGHFVDSAPVSNTNWRQQIISSIGDVVPLELVVGSQTVYTSSSVDLVLVTWFRGRYMYVLAIRSAYPFPKTVLRAALGVSA